MISAYPGGLLPALLYLLHPCRKLKYRRVRPYKPNYVILNVRPDSVFLKSHRLRKIG
jgi:hypothetical protein